MNLLLILIIIAAFEVRVVNLNYNSPFLDEATYIFQGLLILKGSINEVINNISWIGGFPLFYPFLSSLFYKLGGIVGSRFLNVLLGSTAVFLIYHFTYALSFFKTHKENSLAALASAVFLAFLPIPISLSRIATYDMLSYTLLLSGLTLFILGLRNRDSKFLIFASGITFLAFLAKYIATIALIPLAIVTIYLFITKTRKEDGAIVLQNFWIPLITLSLLALLKITPLWEYIIGQSQGENATFTDVFGNFWRYTWIPVLLGTYHIGIGRLRNIRNLFLYIIAFIPLLLHLFGRNSTSVGQHSFLSLIALSPLSGAVSVHILSRVKSLRLPIMVISIVAIIAYSMSMRNYLEHFWPNTTAALTYLAQNVTSGDRILAETDDVVTLTLSSKIPSSSINGPFYFAYGGSVGEKAYLAAISDGYFQYIELDGLIFSAQLLQAIEEGTTKTYNKVFDDGKVRIYSKK